MNHWQPTASLSNLRQRARIIGRIPEFFGERGVLEVETPTLSAAAVSDPRSTPRWYASFRAECSNSRGSMAAGRSDVTENLSAWI